MSQKDTNDTLRSLGITGGIGMILAACILGGYFAGSYLDSVFGTAPWLMLVFLLVGLAAGFFEIYNIMKKLSKNNK